MSPSPAPDSLQDILAGLLLDDVDDIVDGDHADQPPGLIDHRRRDQRIFLEAERDLLLIHVDRDQRLLARHHVGDRRPRAACAGSTRACRCRSAGGRDRRRRSPRNRSSDPRCGADNRARRRPSICSGTAIRSRCIRRPADSSGKLSASSIAARSSGSIARRTARWSSSSMSSMIATASSVSSWVARSATSCGCERVDQLLAHPVVHLGEHVAVEQLGERGGERAALLGRRQLEQIGEIGRVERRDERARALGIAGLDAARSPRRRIRASADRPRRGWRRCPTRLVSETSVMVSLIADLRHLRSANAAWTIRRAKEAESGATRRRTARGAAQRLLIPPERRLVARLGARA